MVIGFNIRNFDYPVLAPYLSFDPLRLPSLDIMQEIEQQVGHRVSLDSVATATLNSCKSGDGLEAINMFRESRLDELNDYCLQDVRITRDIFNYGREKNKIYFSSNYNNRKKVIRVDWKFPQIFKEEQKINKSKARKKEDKINLKLNSLELNDIYQCLLAREAIGELTENDDRSEVIEKIKKMMSKEDLQYCQQRTEEVLYELNEFMDSRYSNYDEEPYYRSERKKEFTVNEDLERDINKAFEKRKRIEMSYESASTQAGDAFLKKRQVDIYKVEGGYFHAFCHLRKEVRMFRMDRVTNFKVLDEKYQVPEEW